MVGILKRCHHPLTNPVHALEIARRWANGEVKTGDAMNLLPQCLSS